MLNSLGRPIFVLCLLLSLFEICFSDEKFINIETNKKYFQLKLTMPQKGFQIDGNEVIVEVFDKKNNPVKGAKINIILWMSEHGHYSSVTPSVKEVNPGKYRITELEFEMAGKWEINLEIKKDKVKDRAKLEIVVSQ